MTGAGFGGCAVALVEDAHVEAFEQNVRDQYQAQTDLEPSVYVTDATQGACRLPA